MEQEILTIIGSQYRFAGWSAIVSGIAGFIAFSFLFAFLVPHLTNGMNGGVLIRSHDACVVLQMLLLILPLQGLYTLSRQRSGYLSRPILNSSVATLCFTILLLLLIFPKIVLDTLYMFPQGAFGICLIVINLRAVDILSRSFRIFGMIVGLGLAMVGCFPLGYAIFVDPVILKIPAVNPDTIPSPNSFSNNIIHLMLMIGTLLGVVTLPVYSILVGRKLLHEKVE